MAIYVANNGQLQTIKGIYYGMTEDYINTTLFHNLVPKTATEIKFLYASDNPDLTGYQKLGYCDDNNYIEVWNNGTKYILINPRKNYIYAPISCYSFLRNYNALTVCVFDNFDTRNTTSMYYMFNGCSSLTTLYVSSFTTQNVTNMVGMFGGCNRLTSLDLSKFDTSNVTDMNGMFSSCFGLSNLDISGFNTAKVLYMGYLFNYCYSLISLNLSSFNTSAVRTMSYMFNNCARLATIISYSFSQQMLNSDGNMFAKCTSLVGGNGTTYSGSYVTAEYARVDGENGLPGYFTAPTN